MSLFFLMIRRPPRSTLFPTRRSSDLDGGPLRIIGGCARADLVLDQRLALEIGRARLNSSHSQISYAVFCLKKKKMNLDGLARAHAAIDDMQPGAQRLRHADEPDYDAL